MPTIKVWRQSTFDDTNGLFDEDILPKAQRKSKREEGARYNRQQKKIKVVRTRLTDYTVQPAADEVNPLSIPLPVNINDKQEHWQPPQAPDND